MLCGKRKAAHLRLPKPSRPLSAALPLQLLTLCACSLPWANASSCLPLEASTAAPSELLLLQNVSSQVLKCTPVPGLFLLPYLWKPLSVHIDCGSLQPVRALCFRASPRPVQLSATGCRNSPVPCRVLPTAVQEVP
jgi:hypothetical protein